MSRHNCLKIQKFIQVSNKFLPSLSYTFSSILGIDHLHPNFVKCVSQDEFSNEHSINNGASASSSRRYKFLYKIPQTMCTPNGRFGFNKNDDTNNVDNTNSNKEKSLLPISGFAAIIDELTTLALVAEDRGTRPGVSVNLSVQMINPALAYVGRDIHIVVQVVKVGKAFGFTKAEAVCADSGKIICVGDHIKYLPIGSWIQEIVLGPGLSFTSWIVSNFLTSKTTTESEADNLLQPDSIDKILNIQNKKIIVNNHHCNPLKICHGGCQAMLIEKFADCDLKMSDTNKHLHSLSITYMASSKISTEINLDSKLNIERGCSSTSTLNIVANNTRGQRISEAILQYTPSSSL